jgi:hypothetical protein
VAGPGAALLALSACRAAPPPAPTLLPTVTYTATEAAFAANIDALNGLPDEDPGIGGRRPAAFALGEEPGTGSPGGATRAELVVESTAPGEGGYTLVTLRQPGTRPDVGPLKAATWRDAVVATSLGAPLAAAEAGAELRRALAEAGLPAVLPLGGGEAPAAPAGRPPAPRWGFAEAPPENGQTATGLSYRAADGAEVRWALDPVLGLWQRQVEGQPARDEAGGEPLAVANLVLLAAPGPAGPAPWWTGQGDARLLRDGVVTPARWVRADARTPLGLLDERGMQLALKPGGSWWVVAPSLDALAIEPAAAAP